MPEWITETTDWYFLLYEQQHWLALIVVAAALNYLGQSFCPNDCYHDFHKQANRTAAVLCVPYLIRLYPLLSFDDISILGLHLFRLYLLYFLWLGACLLVIPCASAVWCWLRQRSRNLNHWSTEQLAKYRKYRELQRQKLWEQLNPSPEPLPRSELLKQQMAEAQQGYELEAQLIEQSSVLDKDEKLVALISAKQRLLKQIDRIIQ